MIGAAVSDRGAAGPATEPPLRVLVVDDCAADRTLLGGLLRGLGFDVAEASCGSEALDEIARARPDLVTMDLVMPGMDGLAATLEMRRRLGDAFVPIIFVTAVTDDAWLERCIEAGGDDFLAKPCNGTLLKAKITAALRARQVHRRLTVQRDELVRHRNRLHDDLAVAQRILGNVASCQQLAAPNVHHVLRPMELLNGDVILGARRPSGEQCFLVGDFTGHGLPAAIGAQIVQGVFGSMVQKGLPIEEIVSELNRRVGELLPTGRFLSACLAELDGETGLLRVWNGGMPDVMIRRASDASCERVASSQVPLGILPPERYTVEMTALALRPGDRMYVCSDGVVEAHDPAGRLFGADRLWAAIAPHADAEAGFPAVLDALAAHTGDAPQHDDLSLLQVTHVPSAATAGRHATARPGATRQPQRFHFALELAAGDLGKVEPVPVVVQVLETVQGLAAHRSALFTILAELYSNALEHGLLRLDSALKQQPEGFATYYAERQARLLALESGRITIDCRHRPTAHGGAVTIRVAHDGAGFDPARLPEMAGETAFAGRGIRLVRALCRSLRYRDGGRTAIAVYEWQTAGTAPGPD